MSAMNTLADLNEAAKVVLQCLKGLPDQADVKIALIGGLALWNYLPQYRSTTVSPNRPFGAAHDFFVPDFL